MEQEDPFRNEILNKFISIFHFQNDKNFWVRPFQND